jgi:hypothetical protein
MKWMSTVDYSDTAAKISQEDFDNTYCQIFEAFYEETPPLFTKIQNTIFDTKVYTARITSQTPTIRTAKRAWQRGLRISLICTPSELDDGLRFLDFSDEQKLDVCRFDLTRSLRIWHSQF